MYFTKVELHNYGIYKGTHEMRLTDRIGKRNITLVGGLNGRGKTTFHDSILIALYGKQALSYIQEKTKSYDKLLLDHINKHATDENTYVAVDMVLDDGARIRIKRNWKLKGKKIEQKVSVEKDGVEDSYLGENWNYYIEEILPFGIARFFFFNNEKITQLADDASFEQIKSSIKSAIGVTTIDKTIEHVDEVIRRKEKALDAFENSELNQEYRDVEGQIAQLDDQIQALTKESQRLEFEWEKKNIEVEAKEKEFWDSGGDLSRNRDAIKNEMNLIEQEVSHLQELITQMASDPATPLALCRDMVMQAYEEKHLQQEDITQKAIESKISSLYERIMHVLSEVNIPHQDMQTVKQIFDDELEEYTSNDNKTMHMKISAASMMLFEKLIGDVFPVINGKIQDLIGDLEAQESKLMSLDAHLGAGDNKSLAMQLFEVLKSLEKERNLTEAAYKKAKESMESMRQQRETLAARRIKLIKKIAEKENSNDDDARIIQYSAMAIQALETFKIQLQTEKIENLSQTITDCFMSLVEKVSLVKRIEVDPITLDVRIIDADGRELLKSQLSAGEQQMFAVSVVWALALTSGYKAPVIIDTPMARLDSSHRSNFVTKYLPAASSQVMVLSTDEEIYGKYLDLVKDNVVDYYTLFYREEEQCTSILHGYFKEGNYDSKTF